MRRIDKWYAVNQCETTLELGALILQFADKNGNLQGRTKDYNAIEMVLGLDLFIKNQMHPNILTLEFGIRQQAIYLKLINT